MALRQCWSSGASVESGPLDTATRLKKQAMDGKRMVNLVKMTTLFQKASCNS